MEILDRLIVGSFDGALGLIGIAVRVLAIWALVDSVLRPERVFQAADQNKWLWVGLNVLAFIIPFFGLLISTFYLLTVRPRVRELQGTRW